MKNNNSLTNDIVKAVALFQEFGIRDFQIRKNDPKEGAYLARCARKIAKRKGNAFAYEWAMDAYTKLVFERNEIRNTAHLSRFAIARACKAQPMRKQPNDGLFLFKDLYTQTNAISVNRIILRQIGSVYRLSVNIQLLILVFILR